jgi:SAM-dependent methyltransferase
MLQHFGYALWRRAHRLGLEVGHFGAHSLLACVARPLHRCRPAKGWCVMQDSGFLELSQVARYGAFYTEARRALARLRFDINYRRRRLHEVLRELGVPTLEQLVLDVGFGSGELLLSFPQSCRLVGVDVSASAVVAAERDPRFATFRAADFFCVPEAQPEAMPDLAADLALSSHVLEHAVDDLAMLAAIRTRLRPGGVLALFVPIEEPDYILFHRRNYSLQSIAERVQQAGFELLFCEGSMYVNGHVWKLLTIPSRRRWPALGQFVDVLRNASLGAIPYPWLKRLDGALFRLGVGARQGLVVARRPRL